MTRQSGPIFCKFFLQGCCRLGNKCRFYHGYQGHPSAPTNVYRRLSGDHGPIHPPPTNWTGSRPDEHNSPRHPISRMTKVNNLHSHSDRIRTPEMTDATIRPTFSFRVAEKYLVASKEVKPSHVKQDELLSEMGLTKAEVFTGASSLSKIYYDAYLSTEPFKEGEIPLDPPTQELCAS
ncbi:unnamed protein product [Calicophoron daubneyi]|uniref:C3H1-type domain-containing protein n=1 Tax=Calicophoron daubneyi TaxID=300641 RepID=A0AAV2TFP2_CALDB